MSAGNGIMVPPVAELRRRIGKKWQAYEAGVLPAWVADMDLLPAPFVSEAIQQALAIGDLGYPPVSEASGLPEAFAAWAERRWGWRPPPESIHAVPEVVAGIDNCIETLTAPGDAIMVQTPIYPPFMSSVLGSGRRLVMNPMGPDGLDLAPLVQQMRTEQVRMVLLCNPHNPTGLMLTREELAVLAEAALRSGAVVVSDEVHADLAYPSSGRRHIPFASLGPDVAARTVTLNAASKAFNIPGLRLAVCAVEDAGLRARLLALPPHRRSAYSTLGVRATLAAWSEPGERWLADCVAHLERVRDGLGPLLAQHLPDVRWTPPMASYLAWLDCRGLGLGVDAFSFFLAEAKVALSRGEDFGPPGAGFLRLNFGTSAEIVEEILRRMGAAVAARRQKEVRHADIDA